MTDGPLDADLRRRLKEIGVDPDAIESPRETWHRLHERFGGRVTLLDRYALEAMHRGIASFEQLDEETRARLGRETVAAQFPGIEIIESATRADGPLSVVPYDRAWLERFRVWHDRLAAALGRAAVRIDHVGSTAVPGLAAKPIVDIQVSVVDVDDEAAYLPAVEGCGLRLRSRDPGHRYLRPSADQPREVHVHVCAIGSRWERDHLLFRDFLRAHPAARDAYAHVKEEAARRFSDDRLAYTDAKAALILHVMEEAAVWADRVGWRVA